MRLVGWWSGAGRRQRLERAAARAGLVPEVLDDPAPLAEILAARPPSLLALGAGEPAEAQYPAAKQWVEARRRAGAPVFLLRFGRCGAGWRALGALELPAGMAAAALESTLRFCRAQELEGEEGRRCVVAVREATEELARSKLFLARVVDGAADGIVVADETDRIRVFNRAAERITGWPAEEQAGRRLAELFGSPGTAQELTARLRAAGEGAGVAQHRTTLRDRRGEDVPVLLSGALLRSDDRECGSSWVFTDLRERVRMEERLAQAQEKLAITEKHAIVSEVSGALAHELNQPLTSVMGYTELLRRSLPESATARRFLETILTETQRMADIVRKIGSLTRYETRTYVGGAQILDLERSSGEEK